MTRATDSRPCPIPTTTAPPAASRYARPSASQIVEPDARTATGGDASADRPKTGLLIEGSRPGVLPQSSSGPNDRRPPPPADTMADRLAGAKDSKRTGPVAPGRRAWVPAP